MVDDKTMWTCPKCKQRFVNQNQWHSCRQNTVDNFLTGKTEKAIRLFKHFIKTYKQIGDFDLHPAKTRIALVARMRFCAINRLGKDFLDGHLVLNQRYSDAHCFHKIDQFGATAFVHHFRIYTKDDVTDELKEYMTKAYANGQYDT